MNLNVEKLKKSEELALFLGMLAGDGCLSVKHNGGGYRIYPISFYNTKKTYVTLFSNLFERIFGIKGGIRCRKRENKLDLWEFEKYSVKIFKLITQDFGICCGKKAKNVKIPQFILNGKTILKKQFLYGLLVTDGGLRKDGSLILHSASRDLVGGFGIILKDVWGIEKETKSYIQKGKFKSYQINLNKGEASSVISELLRWHNLVLRGFYSK